MGANGVSPLCAHCALAALMVCSALGANAASYERWSSFIPPPVVGSCPEAAQAQTVPVGMWGCNGELWNSSGPLNDWSFAGYAAGLRDMPHAAAAVDVVRDYEAAGNGLADDTAAVLAALEATKHSGGVIYFPPGKYLLSAQLNMSSNQVLRGAGRDATTLYFNTSLQQLYGWGPNWEAGRENSPYTWAGGLISTQRETYIYDGWGMRLGDVSRPAARGDRRLYVRDLKRGAARADAVFVPGEWLALRMFENRQADFAKALCNNRTEVGSQLGSDFGDAPVFTHTTRITAAGEDWVEFERPLHVDVSLEFKPVLLTSSNFKVTGVGVEDLTIEFPWTPYLGHHEEAGYNAIEFESAVDSWIRRVRIVNADAAIKLYASIFNTISDVQITSSPWSRKGGRWNGRNDVMQLTENDGHIGIALHWACHDNLVEKFNITGTYHHDLLVAGYSAHNVFQNGSGTDVCLDHHGGAPHNNLWTDIDLGSGQAAMRWSGAPEHFPFAGSNNVFWNIWASKIPVRHNYVGHLAATVTTKAASERIDMYQQRRRTRLYMMNRPAHIQGFGQVVVDMPLDSNFPTIKEAGDWFIQYNPDQRVWPPNLFTAMKATQAQRLQLSVGNVSNSTADGSAPRPNRQLPLQPAPVISQLLPVFDSILHDVNKDTHFSNNGVNSTATAGASTTAAAAGNRTAAADSNPDVQLWTTTHSVQSVVASGNNSSVASNASAGDNDQTNQSLQQLEAVQKQLAELAIEAAATAAAAAASATAIVSGFQQAFALFTW